VGQPSAACWAAQPVDMTGVLLPAKAGAAGLPGADGQCNLVHTLVLHASASTAL
jgi:hypothetical protein